MSSNNDNPFCFCICWWQGRKLATKVKCKLKRNDGPHGMNCILVIQNIWQMPMGKPCKDNYYFYFLIFKKKTQVVQNTNWVELNDLQWTAKEN